MMNVGIDGQFLLDIRGHVFDTFCLFAGLLHNGLDTHGLGTYGLDRGRARMYGGPCNCCGKGAGARAGAAYACPSPSPSPSQPLSVLSISPCFLSLRAIDLSVKARKFFSCSVSILYQKYGREGTRALTTESE